MTPRSLLKDDDPIRHVDRDSAGQQQPGAVMATEDPHVIREWANRHGAEPATGQPTSSGPGVVDVNDGGAGIRFNFPGAARFRPISWDEWFRNFTEYDLTFVYEADVSGQPPGNRYRLVPKTKLPG
jgi:hypothetical protein